MWKIISIVNLGNGFKVTLQAYECSKEIMTHRICVTFSRMTGFNIKFVKKHWCGFRNIKGIANEKPGSYVPHKGMPVNNEKI